MRKAASIALFVSLLGMATLSEPIWCKPTSEVKEVSQEDFNREILASKEPVLVDFYATWCPPCKKMAPVLDAMSARYSGKIKMYRMDVDKNKELAEALGITAVPTFVIFKNGIVVQATQGVLRKNELATRLDVSLR